MALPGLGRALVAAAFQLALAQAQLGDFVGKGSFGHGVME